MEIGKATAVELTKLLAGHTCIIWKFFNLGQ